MIASHSHKKSLALIVNPTAGRGAAGRALSSIKSLLSRRFDGSVTVYLTERGGDGERLAISALLSGAETVVAVGGDGTLHEVANAMLSGNNTQDAAMALIPFGTGNDFARAVGLRLPLPAIIDVIASGECRMIDVGMIDSPSLPRPKWFLVAAGIGFVADTARTVNNQVKYLTGPAAYVYGACATLRSFQPVEATLTFDETEPKIASLALVSVSNVATTGGGIKIAPDARPDDGFFDVCLVESLPKLQLLAKLPLAFQGRHIDDPRVNIARCAKLQIETKAPSALWIDGEVTGSTPAAFQVRPSALRMVLPPILKSGMKPGLGSAA